jgi:hypothetical protein
VRPSERLPAQNGKEVVVEDLDESEDCDAIAARRCVVECDLRSKAQLAVVAQVRETWGQPKIGTGGKTRGDERLRVVELNIRHEVDPLPANVKPFDELVQIFKRVLKLKIAENIAVSRPLNSVCIPGLGLYSQRT